MSGPSADATLLALCCEARTISTLLAAIDANELDIDSAGLASATERFWVCVLDITGTPATSEAGRIAKVKCAALVLRTRVVSNPDRTMALVGSALHDVIAGVQS